MINGHMISNGNYDGKAQRDYRVSVHIYVWLLEYFFKVFAQVQIVIFKYLSSVSPQCLPMFMALHTNFILQI